MLSRRVFVSGSLFAVLGATLARPSAAFAKAEAGPDLWLNRLTFGATDAARARLAALGPEEWLEEQLALPAFDASLEGRLSAARLRIVYESGEDGEGGRWTATDELRPLSGLGADPEALLPLIDWTLPMDFAERTRPADEVIAAALIRAVHAPTQLREVMTQFWHDHFNVHAQKDEYTAVFFPTYDAALRDHALGRFRDLLGVVARAPAMLFYLNNADSRASPANENFARELLELHTLGAAAYLNDRYDRWHEVPKGTDGVASGYIDEDVYEVARAFTGWTVGDGRWLAEGMEAPRTGRFFYADIWHDPYQKRILGVEFPPNRAAMADGEQVLDMLSRHPATARFVCGKIARRLLADDPDPALVDRLAQVFLTHSDDSAQIAHVLRALVADPAFAAPPSKLRRPFEYLAALLRATGAEVRGTENAYHWQLGRAGWHQHTCAPPTGHPDRTEDWTGTSTLLRLVDYALGAQEDWFGVTSSRLSAALPADVATVGDLAAFWSARLTGRADALDGLPDWFGMAAADPLPEAEVDRHEMSAVAVAFAALTPAFVFR